jgi:hypothetical protein
MRIVVFDDYADALRRCVGRDCLAGHEVAIHRDAAPDEAALLIQQRCAPPGRVIAQLPALRFIAQTSRWIERLDLAACAARDILVSARARDPHLQPPS